MTANKWEWDHAWKTFPGFIIIFSLVLLTPSTSAGSLPDLVNAPEGAWAFLLIKPSINNEALFGVSFHGRNSGVFASVLRLSPASFGTLGSCSSPRPLHSSSSRSPVFQCVLALFRPLKLLKLYMQSESEITFKCKIIIVSCLSVSLPSKC